MIVVHHAKKIEEEVATEVTTEVLLVGEVEVMDMVVIIKLTL